MQLDPRYPIGAFSLDTPVRVEETAIHIAEIAGLPALLREALGDAGEVEYEATYRPGGWTVRQLVHHLVDSHVHGYIRCKLALTESDPTIKPYDADGWSGLPDVAAVEPEVSLVMLDALHARWAVLLRSLDPTALARSYIHPEHGRAMSLTLAIANYAWHGRHHVAHVRTALAGLEKPEDARHRTSENTFARCQ